MFRMDRVISLVSIIALLFLPSMNECRLQIKIQPEVFRVGDRDVQLICSSSLQTQSSIQHIMRLRLRKITDDNTVWTDIAEIGQGGTTMHLGHINATVSGHVGDTHPATSFLNVTWSVASSEVFGRYMCDGIGYTQSRAIVVEDSETLDVKGLSSDSLQLYELIKESQRVEIEKSDLILRDVIANLWSDVSSKFNEIESRQLNVTAANQELRRIAYGNEEDNMMWPEGNFSLLMPDTGCPLNPPSWNKGFLKMMSSKNYLYNPINKPEHFATPYSLGTFVYQQFCSMRHSPERSAAHWPSGSYCINGIANSTCPFGFSPSTLRIDFKSATDNLIGGIIPAIITYSTSSSTSRFASVNFCCRHDASPYAAIDLPVSNPFYLYRHGGTCQNVTGMHVTQDVFMMHTEGDSGGDAWTGGQSVDRPDVSLFNPLMEELCYYSRNKSG